MEKIENQYSIAIIGGGISGITAAYELARSGKFQVTVFEKENHLGGLSSYYKWDNFVFDKFYHVLLPNDRQTLKFIEDVGLDSELLWRETKSGFYGENKLVSLSSSLDFIRFPYLTLWQKFRLGLGILYSTRVKNPSELDKIYAREWLVRIFGNSIYYKIWEPLLRSKLADANNRTSAAFIWANITRLYGARSTKEKQEKMGCVLGGYYSILNTYKKKLSELNVNIMINTSVINVESIEKENKINILSNSNTMKFDRVLFTVPCPEVLRIISGANGHSYWQKLGKIEYLEIACVFLILKRSLSPYYVINLLDKDLPFTGIIESTNVIPPLNFGERHLVYLPKYMPKDDPITRLSDDQIFSLFIDKLKKIFPDLRDDEILHHNVFREKYVQPIQELYYLDNIADFRTPLPNIYLVNTTMISDSTINNNAVIGLAKKAAGVIIADLND